MRPRLLVTSSVPHFAVAASAAPRIGGTPSRRRSAFRQPLPRPDSSGKIGGHAPRRVRSARRRGGRWRRRAAGPQPPDRPTAGVRRRPRRRVAPPSRRRSRPARSHRTHGSVRSSSAGSRCIRAPASVLHSTTGDLILTAAHCLADGVDASFVPGFAESAAPQDFWHVDAVYLDPRWVATQDPLADFAVARVSRQDGGSVESRRRRGADARGRRRSRDRRHASPATRWASGERPSAARPDVAALERGYPVAAVRRPGRRHQRVAVAGRLDGGRDHRRARRRRLRRERVLLTALRRRDRAVARAGRGRWPGRRRAVGVRRRLLIRP